MITREALSSYDPKWIAGVRAEARKDALKNAGDCDGCCKPLEDAFCQGCVDKDVKEAFDFVLKMIDVMCDCGGEGCSPCASGRAIRRSFKFRMSSRQSNQSKGEKGEVVLMGYKDAPSLENLTDEKKKLRKPTTKGAGRMKKCSAEHFSEKLNPWASYTYTCEKADGHLGMHRDAAHGAWGFEKPKERKP